MQKRTCSTPECDSPHYAKGLCKRHYSQRPEQRERQAQYDRDRRANDPVRQEAERQRNRGRQQYITEWGRRRAMPRWAAWWEAQRRAEDLADLATVRVVHGKGAQRIPRYKARRTFVAGACPDCGVAVTVVRHRWCGSIRCLPCTKARWRETHYARAERYDVQFDVIDPLSIYERDGWRCQICGGKVVREWGSPKSATLDHIVPMSCGGPHTRDNLQTAHAVCNARKGARSANDQLRLIG